MNREQVVTLALVFLAVFTVGAACGSVTTVVIGPEPQVVKSTVTVTMPPRTITVTRASRSQVSRPPVSDTETSGEYQTYARNLVASDQWPCLRELVQRESSWNPENVTGSHYGLFQMRGLKRGTPWRYQVVRGLSYIEHRYGTPCAALAHSDQHSWY